MFFILNWNLFYLNVMSIWFLHLQKRLVRVFIGRDIQRLLSLSQATGSTPGGKFGGREQRTGWAAGSRRLWYYLCLQGTSVRIHELVLRKTSIVFDKDYVSYVTARFF